MKIFEDSYVDTLLAEQLNIAERVVRKGLMGFVRLGDTPRQSNQYAEEEIDMELDVFLTWMGTDNSVGRVPD